MARNLNSTLVTAIQQQVVQPVLLAEFDFPGSIGYYFTGYGTLNYGGNTYYGSGMLLSIGNIEETTDTAAKNLTFSMSGIPSAMISTVLAGGYQGQPAKLSLGVYYGGNLYVNQIFGGQMDTMSVMEDGQTATISLSCESDLYRLTIPSGWQYTQSHQNYFHAGDNFFEYCTGIALADMEWGIGSTNSVAMRKGYN